MRLPKAQKKARPHELGDKKEVSMREEKFGLGLERIEEHIYVGGYGMSILALARVGRGRVGGVRVPCVLSILCE